MKSLALALVLVIVAAPARAQQVGTCQSGEADADLDVNNVRARLYNNGGFFWRGSGNVYTVPKEGEVSAIFAAGLWFGAEATDGTLRFSGVRYGPWEFWPGPLDENGSPPDDCADYDRLYSVYDADIRAYEYDGTLTDDLRDWPHHLGAPVVDGDGIAGNYDLAAGDRPHVYGEQSVWWVMNDMGNQKGARGLGLEVQVQAFSASCIPGFHPSIPDVRTINKALAHATYYEITTVYHGREVLGNMHFGWFMDADLGYAGDDFMGTDTTLGMGFVYNGDDVDASPEGYGYGTSPPAVGALMAQGHLNAQPITFDYGADYGNRRFPGPEPPTIRAPGHFLMMQGRWADGMPHTLGGDGYGGDTPTPFMFPGDPVTQQFWSEENPNGQRGTLQPGDVGYWPGSLGNVQSSRNEPGDRRVLMSSGPHTLMPGDTMRLVVALPWAQGGDRLRSVTMLRETARHLRNVLTGVMRYDIRACPIPVSAQPAHPAALNHYTLRQNYPEPFSQQTTIRYEVIDTVPVTLTVYDLLGRRVRTLVDGMQSAGVYDVVFEAGDLPTGLYFYRLEAAGYVSITRRMTLQR
ncbi:MAG: T9SS type A sorting domain-containing protein [Bacteroidota bacterium]